MKDAAFTSDFAILDVLKGRAALAKRLYDGERVRVRCDLVIERQHGRDDGTSIEFSCHVNSVKEFAR